MKLCVETNFWLFFGPRICFAIICAEAFFFVLHRLDPLSWQQEKWHVLSDLIVGWEVLGWFEASYWFKTAVSSSSSAVAAADGPSQTVWWTTTASSENSRLQNSQGIFSDMESPWRLEAVTRGPLIFRCSLISCLNSEFCVSAARSKSTPIRLIGIDAWTWYLLKGFKSQTFLKHTNLFNLPVSLLKTD